MSRLVPFALGLEPELLDELRPLHGRACMCGQCLEEPQVVVVEGGEALVTVERDKCSEGSFSARERHNYCAPEFAEERVGVRFAFVASGRSQQQARLLVVDGPGDHRRAVDDRLFDR